VREVLLRIQRFACLRRGAPSEKMSLHFSWLASQYYVAGRAAVFSGSAPVAGNLLHHAIEMFLKSELVRVESPARLRRRGHQLISLWKAFKAIYPAVPLVSHDRVIKDLEKFERIRYPDTFTKTGMFFSIPIVRPVGPSTPNSVAGGRTPPTYSVALAEVDTLVRAILDSASLNRAALFVFLTPEGREVLHRDNVAIPAA